MYRLKLWERQVRNIRLGNGDNPHMSKIVHCTSLRMNEVQVDAIAMYENMNTRIHFHHLVIIFNIYHRYP